MTDLSFIHDIILQLVHVSNAEDKMNRDDDIRFLTPIDKVSNGPSGSGEPENTFIVGKVIPKGEKNTFDDMVTWITSKKLYPHYMNLNLEDFKIRFNKTLFDYITIKLNEAKGKNVPDSDNIWIQPNAAFVSWFQEQGIEIESQLSFIDDEDNVVNVEYYSRRGCTKAQLNYLKLFLLTKEYIKSQEKKMVIREAVKHVYRENKNVFPKWSENSLNKYYHVGQNISIDL